MADTDRELRRPHSFFWTVIAALVPAAIAAFSAEPREPSYALGSLWVYRLEIGLAFFIGLYALMVVLWLAYRGRAFREIEFAGGKVKMPDPGLSAAADGFKQFQEDATARLGEHDESLEILDERVEALERGRP